MNITTTRGGGVETLPTFHVQGLKDPGVGGGFGDKTVDAAADLNYITINEINGATLTTRNGSDVEVVSGVKGLHGRTDIPINNPDASTHRTDCYITLPAGTYYIKWDVECDGNVYGSGLYNRTAAEYIGHTDIAFNTQYKPYMNYLKIVLSVQTDLDMRTSLHSGGAEAETNLAGSTNTHNIQYSLAHMVVSKLK